MKPSPAVLGKEKKEEEEKGCTDEFGVESALLSQKGKGGGEKKGRHRRGLANDARQYR